MKIAYFDCFSGISGNMVLGAFLDSGLAIDDLRAELAKLKLDGYAIEATAVKKNGIAGTLVDVPITETGVHRHLPDIEAIIEQSELSDWVKDNSKAIFHRLAEAEAQVHGTTLDHIHFHEVGAMDAIVDIVGSVIALELLGIDYIMSSPIPTGHGWIVAAHGRLPVPAPATAALLKGVPSRELDVEAELTTPTGAAIIATMADKFGLAAVHVHREHRVRRRASGPLPSEPAASDDRRLTGRSGRSGIGLRSSGIQSRWSKATSTT